MRAPWVLKKCAVPEPYREPLRPAALQPKAILSPRNAMSLATQAIPPTEWGCLTPQQKLMLQLLLVLFFSLVAVPVPLLIPINDPREGPLNNMAFLLRLQCLRHCLLPSRPLGTEAEAEMLGCRLGVLLGFLSRPWGLGCDPGQYRRCSCCLSFLLSRARVGRRC